MKIVCLTSNLYLNCLQPFAYYWNRFTSDQEFGTYPVTVACYDVLPEGLPENFEVVSIGKQSDYTWSAGLLKFLEGVQDEIILLMLEDYWLVQAIDRPELDWMRRIIEGDIQVRRDGQALNDPSIVKIDLSNDRMKVSHQPFGEYMGIPLIQSANDAPFQTSLQAAFWRKDFLMHFLDPSENAWQFEKKGTKRVIEARNTGNFDGVILGCEYPLFHYANAVGGEGNHPGVITTKYMPIWQAEECRARGWVK